MTAFSQQSMKIAIIGAGVAGIASLKYVLESGYECDCYEETENFGGTWVYTDEVGVNNDGNPICRNMYKNLVTNLPRVLMSFSGFSYEKPRETSLKQPEVYQYLTNYVKTFNLEPSIKYYQRVTEVSPLHGKWLVTSKHVKSKIIASKVYEFVFICNGHFSNPRIPKIPGQNLFGGLQMHSQDYRNPDIFQDKRVLIIGAGNSGVDQSQLIGNVAKTVFLSYWKPMLIEVPNIHKKTAVAELTEDSVIFTDGTIEEIDVIIYATGYNYSFPFLSEDCKVTVCDNCVKPLYKEIVNIEFPTMFFINIPFLSASFLISDIQARFAMAVINKTITLPSKPEMVNELNARIKKLKSNKVPQRYFHRLGYDQRAYINELVKSASLEPYPPVYSNIYDHLVRNSNIIRGGAKSYSLIDNETYVEN